MSNRSHKCNKSHKRKYYNFNYPDHAEGGKTLLTGIRGIKCKPKKVYISGFYEPSPNQQDQEVKSFVYKGCLCGSGKWYLLNYPSSPGVSVNVTNLYGPNNGYKKNTIQIVGNYTTQENTNLLGCLYEGSLDGSGKWTTLVPTTLSSDPVINTIAHSNMGGLVVGNYDTILIQGKAFIYDIKKKVYYDIVKDGAISITAYGIWHNGCNSYTICGGYKYDNLESESGYLVDWDNKTKKFANWRSYYFDNNPVESKITHFDGVTGNGKSKYNLTGDWSGISNFGGFFATVKRKKCRKFTKAKWSSIKYPGSKITSGNSVYRETVIGVYKEQDSEDINGYISVTKK